MCTKESTIPEWGRGNNDVRRYWQLTGILTLRLYRSLHVGWAGQNLDDRVSLVPKPCTGPLETLCLIFVIIL